MKKRIYIAGSCGMLGEAFYAQFKEEYDIKCTDKDVNPFYKKQVADGHFMEQCSYAWVPQIKASTAIEAGLFAQNIAALCLEKDIHYSFTVCFPGKKEKWKDISFIKEEPLLLMSLGYKKTFRREYMLAERKRVFPDPKDWHTNDDYKVHFENVVHYE